MAGGGMGMAKGREAPACHTMKPMGSLRKDELCGGAWQAGGPSWAWPWAQSHCCCCWTQQMWTRLWRVL